MRECVLYYVFKKKSLNGAKLNGATEKKVFSIPARNSINNGHEESREVVCTQGFRR
ncbi:unnamed protein product [Ectocarpus sp. CCAP 1310/34]|nr:unnamed protein product [Ectocarpus sp. CCAP 1310/34]